MHAAGHMKVGPDTIFANLETDTRIKLLLVERIEQQLHLCFTRNVADDIAISVSDLTAIPSCTNKRWGHKNALRSLKSSARARLHQDHRQMSEEPRT